MRRVSEFIAVLFLLVGVGHAAAAQRRVTGRVTEEGSTNPVPSATVSVQGTTLLALTGADGNFALNNVPAGAQTLIVRRIGYRRAVATLSADATTANVSMGHDPLELEEVVVTG